MTSSVLPVVVLPAGWAGNDGNWTTFQVSVGTPPQAFQLLPSTYGSETWVPLPQGCQGILATVKTCPQMRGVESFNGPTSQGFYSNASSTYDFIGLDQLSSAQGLFDDTAAGLYFLDTLDLSATQSSGNVSLASQLVAGTSATTVWLGSLGLGPAAGSFEHRSGSIPSLIWSMRAQNLTPSLSYGYTAGAYYSQSQTPGSLVFGGYDRARFTPSNISFPLTDIDSPLLPVTIQNIFTTGLDGQFRALLRNGSIKATIDSTVSQSWLPKEVCDEMASIFSLRYDSMTDLYLVNSTIHAQLREKNPSFTFTLAPIDDNSTSLNIVVPYSAFDLQAGIPLYNFSTNYFPIKVAADATQQVLGRQFLQEAYLVVDWERQNFTLGQAIHQNAVSQIQPIYSVASSSSSHPSSASSHLSAGAKAGIAVGVIAAVLLISLAFFLFRRRRHQQQNRDRKSLDDSLDDEHGEKTRHHPKSDQAATEIHSTPIHELHHDPVVGELSGEVHHELEGSVPLSEADSTPVFPPGFHPADPPSPSSPPRYQPQHGDPSIVSTLSSGFPSNPSISNSGTASSVSPISPLIRPPYGRFDGEDPISPIVGPPYGRFGGGVMGGSAGGSGGRSVGSSGPGTNSTKSTDSGVRLLRELRKDRERDQDRKGGKEGG